MFDEPLTVIDPHLKWQLRSKLKELHQRVGATMIYVTHDQTEALTFADQVVVMHEGDGGADRLAGRAVRAPAPHLRRPLHRLAGHEHPALRGPRRRARSSPAMPVATANRADRRRPQPRSACGPSSSRSPPTASRSRSQRVADAGRHRIVEAAAAGQPRSTRSCPRARRSPPGPAHLAFDPAQTRIYVDGWLAEGAAHEDREPEGLVVRAAGRAARRLQRPRSR